jgi:hydroxymethylbilane synthase
MATLKMGTRGSALALAQSSWAARALEARHPGLKVETVVITTSGDRFGAPSPEEAKKLPQGAKGLWVKELEEALLQGAVDFACHSAKDLPAGGTAGLLIAAYPEREDPRDCLVSKPGLSYKGLKAGHVIGTSSLRRQQLLNAAVPGLTFTALRGNVDTRLRKLGEGQCDAMVLAVAGLKRLGKGAVAHEPIDPSAMIPSPGQGALALQARAGQDEAARLVAAMDHAATRECVELEREFLNLLGGGCGAPVAAHARRQACGLLFEGYYAADGEAAGKRVQGLLAGAARAEAFARDMAAQARSR